MSTARLFVAIDLNPELRAALGAATDELSRVLPRMKWVGPDSMHLTIRFLGETPLSAVEAIDAAVGPLTAKCPPVRILVAGIGVFPTVRRPSVLWAGVTEGAAALCDLADSVRDALARARFGEDKHPFSAHITLGRVRRRTRIPGRKLKETLNAWASRQFGALEVHRIVLYRSTLTPEGAIYDALRTWPLQAP